MILILIMSKNNKKFLKKEKKRLQHIGFLVIFQKLLETEHLRTTFKNTSV